MKLNTGIEFKFGLALLLFVLITFIGSKSQTLNDIYDVLPDVPNCKEGTLKDSEKLKILQLVNEIRSLHGLKPVTYNYNKDIYSSKAALMIAANEALDHQPPQSWKCWTQDGRTGAENCNLYIYWATGAPQPSENAIYSWMIDGEVSICGHRRWLIDPFLKFISFARVDGASTQLPSFNILGATIYVIDNDKQIVADWDSNFVAYPYHDYPVKFFREYGGSYWYLSFTAIFDKINYWNNQSVDYSNTTILITEEQGHTVPVSNIQRDNSGYGVPNCLIWQADNLQDNVRYNVSITRVQTPAGNKDYSYWFKLGEGGTTTLQPPILSLPANNSTDVQVPITFSWSASTGATAYELQVSTGSDFSAIFYNKADIVNTSISVDASFSQNTKYFWRIKAINATEQSSWTSVFSFTTKSFSISSPEMLSPQDNEENIPRNATFVWAKASVATGYNLQVSKLQDFPESYIDINATVNGDTSYHVSVSQPLDMNSYYYWRIKSLAGAVESGWSPVRAFRTGSDIIGVDELLTGNGINLNVFPNPAADMAWIRFNLAKSCRVALKIYNLDGIIVSVVIDSYFGEGYYSVPLDALKFSPGAYYCEIVIDGSSYIKPFQIIR